jgi:hypothetical protein
MQPERRPIPGFDGYLADAEGGIWSTRNGLKKLKPRGSRYSYVNLGGVDVGVHRAVCAAFHGPSPFAGAQAQHGDDDPRNNRSENLKWGTSSENARQMVERGRQRIPLGVDHHNAKLTPDMVRSIRATVDGGESRAAVARRLGLNRQTVVDVVSRRYWRHVAADGPSTVGGHA